MDLDIFAGKPHGLVWLGWVGLGLFGWVGFVLGWFVVIQT